MAFINAATTTTLGQFMADVRARANALSEQASKVHRLTLVSIIHDAVTSVRTLAGKAVDEFYYTAPVDISVTDSVGYADGEVSYYDISSINTASIQGMNFIDATTGLAIPVYDPATFDNLRTTYSGVSDLASARFARIVNTSLGGNNKLALQVFTGTSLGFGSNIGVTYPRNPIKVTSSTDKMDLPESLIPICKDFAIVGLFRKIGNQPPLEEDGRVRAYINSSIQRFGYELSEKK